MKRHAFLAVVMSLAVTGCVSNLKVMSYNVCHCKGMDEKVDIVRTAERIRSEDPDFACLQEIDKETGRVGGMDQPAELARLTGLHATFAKAIPFDGGEYGIMLLSREKPRRVVKTPLPGSEPRMLLICEFEDVIVATSHLSVSTPAEREASIPIIRKAFSEFEKPVIFTGDWNAHADSDVLKALRQFLVVKSKEKCRTFHGHPMNGPDGRVLPDEESCIDYIAVDARHAPEFEVTDSYVVEDRITSDHAPIVVRFRTRD